MSCERCGGLMVIETICDLKEGKFRGGINMTWCLICGNFEDTCIRTNRVISRVSRQVETHTVETKILSAIQTRALERAISIDGVVPESPPDRSPRLPVGLPSAKIRMLNPRTLNNPPR
jgi:hypothetical protein